ncbi:MAG: hypothetical protein ACOYJ2_02085 [Rickettsiales bacterium]
MMSETTNSSPKSTTQPAASAPEKPKERTGIAALFPQWVVDNATRITNAGLMTFTSVMLYSSLVRGKQISKDLYATQIKDIDKGIVQEAEKLVSEGKIAPSHAADHIATRKAQLLESGLHTKIIKPPTIHKMRLFYLLTAITSFAVGAFFKRKEETKEELDGYSKLGLPEYMGTRFQQAFDPINHSRQTVGVLSGASGVMAVMSALSQPGGVHKSELYVGSTLAAGGALLAFINDPKIAQTAFSTLWMMRLPAIVTGTKESILDSPKYVNPFVNEFKKTPDFLADKARALNEGYSERVKPFWGVFGDLFGKGKDVPREGIKAVKAYEKAFVGKHTIARDYKRMDIAYPIGQWGNLASAGIGYLGVSAVADPKTNNAAPAEGVKPEATPSQNPVIADVPQNKVGAPTQASRLREAPALEATLPVASHG